MKYIIAFFLCVFAFPVMAQSSNDAYVRQAKTWLNDLDMATARFEQIDYQGHSLYGTFYIDRPGRLRFEYDDPIKDYIVADGYMIYFYDGTSGQVNSGPIGSTLADFILRDTATFDDKIAVKAVRERDDMVNITLYQKDQPGTGELILRFSKSPFMLKSWQIIDAQGLTTDVVLSNLDRTAQISPTKFVFRERNLNQ